MASTRTPYQLIARFVSGNITGPEKAILSDWVKIDPKNKEIFDLSCKLWDHAVVTSDLEEADTDKEWDRLKDLLKEEKLIKKSPSQHTHKIFYWAAAASVMLFLTAAMYVFWLSKPVEVAHVQKVEGVKVLAEEIDSSAQQPQAITSPEYIIVEAKNAIRRCVLPDNSLIWLDSRSLIMYPVAFNNREVTLSGQAFFKVQKMEHSPFVVYAQSSQTEVLGTSFNIKCNKQNGNVENTVYTGKVKFSSADKEVLLTPGEKGLLNGNTQALTVVKSKSSANPNWMQIVSSSYEKEKSMPKDFLVVEARWKENLLNQTVVETNIFSSASRVTYCITSLKATYYTRSGQKKTKIFQIDEKLSPKSKLNYKLKFWDILNKTNKLTIETETVKTCE